MNLAYPFNQILGTIKSVNNIPETDYTKEVVHVYPELDGQVQYFICELINLKHKGDYLYSFDFAKIEKVHTKKGRPVAREEVCESNLSSRTMDSLYKSILNSFYNSNKKHIEVT
jgi:hypothetical protein